MLTFVLAAIALGIMRWRGVPWRTALITVGAGWLVLFVAAVLLNLDLFTAGQAPGPNTGSVSVEEDPVSPDGQVASMIDSARIQNIQRISWALIEYGKSQGLKQRGYENLVVRGLDTWDDPRLVTMLLVERKTFGAMFSSSYEPIVYSAMMWANMGMFGGGDDLYSGPSSSDARLASVERFIVDLNEPPAKYVEPSGVYANMYQRVQNTDVNDMTIGEDDPGYPFNQIAIVNSALITAGPHMTEDGQRSFLGYLMGAENKYMLAVAKGETTMSYPEYLESIGAEDWL